MPAAGRYRTDLTMRQLAPLFGCSPATVCRVIHRLGPLLAIEPATRSAEATDRPWIADGTLIPVRDRNVGASSRTYRFSANVQVIIDADIRLVIATAPPVPGSTADAEAWRDSGLAGVCQGVTVLGDGAYINTGLVVPHRKRPGRPLLPGEDSDNTEHRRVRARVEHAFARMKHDKILRDRRQRGNGLHHAVQAVATLHNHALCGADEEHRTPVTKRPTSSKEQPREAASTGSPAGSGGTSVRGRLRSSHPTRGRARPTSVDPTEADERVRGSCGSLPDRCPWAAGPAPVRPSSRVTDPTSSPALRAAACAVLDGNTPETLRHFLEVGRYEVD